MARQTKTREALMRDLSEVFREYQRSVDKLDELATDLMGVNRTDARVLDLLEENGRMAAGEIAEAAGITSGAVTGVLDRLERSGYARRARVDGDRRKVLVEPTEKLQRAAREIYWGLGPKADAKMRGYTDDDIRVVLRFLRDTIAVTDEQTSELRDGRSVRGAG
jgi:DNA-binding MarR family transcriptional regulator